MTKLDEIIKQPYADDNGDFSKVIDTVYVCGLAYDYCVGSTAYDAAIRGYKSFVIRDATRSVASDSEEKMEQKLKEANVIEITSQQL